MQAPKKRRHIEFGGGRVTGQKPRPTRLFDAETAFPQRWTIVAQFLSPVEIVLVAQALLAAKQASLALTVLRDSFQRLLWNPGVNVATRTQPLSNALPFQLSPSQSHSSLRLLFFYVSAIHKAKTSYTSLSEPRFDGLPSLCRDLRQRYNLSRMQLFFAQLFQLECLPLIVYAGLNILNLNDHVAHDNDLDYGPLACLFSAPQWLVRRASEDEAVRLGGHRLGLDLSVKLQERMDRLVLQTISHMREDAYKIHWPQPNLDRETNRQRMLLCHLDDCAGVASLLLWNLNAAGLFARNGYLRMAVTDALGAHDDSKNMLLALLVEPGGSSHLSAWFSNQVAEDEDDVHHLVSSVLGDLSKRSSESLPSGVDYDPARDGNWHWSNTRRLEYMSPDYFQHMDLLGTLAPIGLQLQLNKGISFGIGFFLKLKRESGDHELLVTGLGALGVSRLTDFYRQQLPISVGDDDPVLSTSLYQLALAEAKSCCAGDADDDEDDDTGDEEAEQLTAESSQDELEHVDCANILSPVIRPVAQLSYQRLVALQREAESVEQGDYDYHSDAVWAEGEQLEAERDQQERDDAMAEELDRCFEDEVVELCSRDISCAC